MCVTAEKKHHTQFSSKIDPKWSGLSDWHHSRVLLQYSGSLYYLQNIPQTWKISRYWALCNSLSLSLLHPSLAYALWMWVCENNVIAIIDYYLHVKGGAGYSSAAVWRRPTWTHAHTYIKPQPFRAVMLCTTRPLWHRKKSIKCLIKLRGSCRVC